MTSGGDSGRQPSAKNRAGAKILLVEDEASIALDIGDLLGDLGCTVLRPDSLRG